jgi:hypothetical protein
MSKKVIILVIILVVAVIGFAMWNKKKKRDLAIAQSSAEQTNANGLFGYLGTVWDATTGGGSKVMSESEAKEISKRIADLKETGAESAEIQAQSLVQELSVNGWSYIGYNQVEAINP